MPQRMFVAKKDVSKNIIYVVPGPSVSFLIISFLTKSANTSQYCSSLRNNKALFSAGLSISNFSWIWGDSPPAAITHPQGFRARIKHLYRMETAPCTVLRLVDIQVDEHELSNLSDQRQTRADSLSSWMILKKVYHLVKLQCSGISMANGYLAAVLLLGSCFHSSSEAC